MPGRPGAGARIAGDGAGNQGVVTTWLRERARLAPNLLTRSPAWVRATFDHAWMPMTALARQVDLLPPGLARFLLSCPGGYIVIAAGGLGKSSYCPGPARVAGRQVDNVAYASVADLARDNELPLHAIGHLVDHHLGCGGAPEGHWLSAGGDLVPEWEEAGRRLQRLFALGYGVDEVARSGIQDYFAQSLALFCRDRRALNIADPQIEKWFRVTLWNEAFWRALATAPAAAPQENHGGRP